MIHDLAPSWTKTVSRARFTTGLSTFWASLTIVGCLLVPSALLANDDPSYSYDSNQKTSHPDWMASLSDDLLLTQVSIPGSHDTMAIGTSLQNHLYSQTQAMDLPTQLASGLRVFDIRAYQQNDLFQDNHGKINLGKSFQDTLNDIDAFLDQHPGEFVLMRFGSCGYSGSGNTLSFEQAFAKYYDKDSHFWIPPVSTNNLWQYPSLHNIRGKIVILQDFDAGATYGIPYASLFAQDNYAFNSGISDQYGKWVDVKNWLNVAAVGNLDRYYINYLSGSTGYTGKIPETVYPYFVASGQFLPATNSPLGDTGIVEDSQTGSNVNWYPDFPRGACGPRGYVCSIYYDGTNPLTTNFLTNWNNNSNYPRIGVIMADFPGPALIDRVIMQNQAAMRFSGDFNGDGQSDVLSYHSFNGNWFLGTLNGEKQLTWTLVDNSSGFGNISADKFFTGDFTHSGKQQVMFYSIGDKNWFLGTVSASNQLTWTLVGNTTGFGNISADKFFTGDFTHSGSQQVMFYSIGDSNWFIGSINNSGQLTWNLAGNTRGFGNLNINHAFFTGDFLGDGRTDVLFYYPGDGNWFLGTVSASGKLNWVRAGNSSGFGDISRDKFFVAPFMQSGHDNIMFYSISDHNWFLGSINSAGALSWSLADNTAGFGNLGDGRPFWTGDFLNAGTSQLMFYYPGDNNWFLGTVSNGVLTWNLATNTSSFGGNLADGRPLWVSSFNGGTQASVLVYSYAEQSWQLGFIGSGNTMTWYAAGNGGIQ